MNPGTGSPPAAPQAPRLPGWLPVLALVPVAVVGAVVWLMLPSRSVPPVASGQASGDNPADDQSALDSMHIPEFTARDQEGRAVDRSIFTKPGRYSVLSFVFTRCVTVCPITTGQLTRLQGLIRSIPTDRVQIVSLSVDPQHDTPATLKEHAASFADFARWTFLSADQATVNAIVEKGLGFALETDTKSTIDLGGGNSMNNIVHPSKFLLISPEGSVVGMYRGMDEDDVNRLILRLRALR